MTNKRRNVKKNNFLAEKMENKPVTDLPGIGPNRGDELKKKGFHTAEDVYKKYLELGRNKNLFKEWMMDKIEADANQSNLTFDCLHAYHATHGNQPCSQAIKMCSTTQKHRDFVAEPMRDEPVTELAGIGRVLGERLKAAGFDKAHNVLGQYSLFRKDTEIFQEWMKDTCNAATTQSLACYQWLCEWCDAFL